MPTRAPRRSACARRRWAAPFGCCAAPPTSPCESQRRSASSMGQKVHPIGFRLGFNKTWNSRWYAEKEYANLVHEDRILKTDLKKRFAHASVAKVEIERAANKLKITIFTARPGIIIG